MKNAIVGLVLMFSGWIVFALVFELPPIPTLFWEFVDQTVEFCLLGNKDGLIPANTICGFLDIRNLTVVSMLGALLMLMGFWYVIIGIFGGHQDKEGEQT